MTIETPMLIAFIIAWAGVVIAVMGLAASVHYQLGKLEGGTKDAGQKGRAHPGIDCQKPGSGSPGKCSHPRVDFQYPGNSNPGECPLSGNGAPRRRSRNSPPIGSAPPSTRKRWAPSSASPTPSCPTAMTKTALSGSACRRRSSRPSRRTKRHEGQRTRILKTTPGYNVAGRFRIARTGRKRPHPKPLSL